MNIFYLDKDPYTAAQYHVDKHCVKMILESAQLLSTAHRILDGNETISKTDTGRNVKRWILPDLRNEILYSATHINHPSAIWCRQTHENYRWLHNLLCELVKEYNYRYGKTHKCQEIGLVDALSLLPKNIPIGEFTDPTPAMPEQYKVPGNGVQSYRNYYLGEKQRMFSWKKRQQPEWINT
jgi:hypothetical protein